jgi:carotenoid cleavage dioxygenase-like enzyme
MSAARWRTRLVRWRSCIHGAGLFYVARVSQSGVDGHGYLREVTFDAIAGVATLRGRYISTPAYVAEAAADRIMYRGLATNTPGGWWKNLSATFRGPRNPANTTVVPWAGQLLCGWEGGLPYAVNPFSLDTIGQKSALCLPPSGSSFFSMLAHMRVDSADGRLVGLQVRTRSNGTICVVWRYYSLGEDVDAHKTRNACSLAVASAPRSYDLSSLTKEAG